MRSGASEPASALIAGATAAVDLPSGARPDPERIIRLTLEFVLPGLGYLVD